MGLPGLNSNLEFLTKKLLYPAVLFDCDFHFPLMEFVPYVSR